MSEQNYMSTRAANATIDELREELTAAQQRVAELERQLANSDQLCREMCRNTFDANESLTADNAALLDDNIRIALERDRLRELLRDAQQVLGTALVTLQEYDVYRKFPVTAAKWAELREKINAELAKEAQ